VDLGATSELFVNSVKKGPPRLSTIATGHTAGFLRSD
jgi:hypothetical protein